MYYVFLVKLTKEEYQFMLYIIIGVIVIIILYLILAYNNLIKNKNLVEVDGKVYIQIIK